MFKNILIAGVAIATSLAFAADYADAFGGRGYARRHVRRASHHVHHANYAPVVHRVYAAPVVRYHAPVHHYVAPVHYRQPVSVSVGPYYSSGYPVHYGGGVSVRVGW